MSDDPSLRNSRSSVGSSAAETACATPRAATMSVRTIVRGDMQANRCVSHGPSVEILLMIGAYPVDEATAKFFFESAVRKSAEARAVRALSYVASLVSPRAVRRISAAHIPAQTLRRQH